MHPKFQMPDGSYWVYGYDNLGQVTNAVKYWADNTLVAGQQFDYTFDTIGNRTQTLSGGDTNGANLRVANYTNNTLNQITSRDVPSYVDVLGASILTNAVTVNGTTAYRKEEYFRQQLGVNNTNSALWTNIIVAGGINVTGNVYVAKKPEVFLYDLDGNLTNDGRWAYTWDAENRLIGLTVNTNVGPLYQLTFAYDYQGRRIQKLVVSNSVAIYTNRFLYDGWNLVAEVDPSGSPIRTYVWGSDLSGSLQGAGGVGGLLEVSYFGASTTNCFPAFDGNGNVMALINAADGTVVANYEYAAFGEPIRITGVMARNNPFRFSTKYDDDESDLLYYGYRYYKPSTGTWLSRDPIQEYGGINIYSTLCNDTINHRDTLGLFGPLAGFAVDCIKSIAGALFVDWLKNKGDQFVLCDKVKSIIRDEGKQICFGYDFEPSKFLNNAEDPSVMGLIAGCLATKINDKGIENLLKGLPESVEKQLLQDAISGGAEAGEDKIKDMVIESSTKTARATCTDKGINVSLVLELAVKVGSKSYTLDVEKKDLGECMGTEKGTMWHDLGCACCAKKK